MPALCRPAPSAPSLVELLRPEAVPVALKRLDRCDRLWSDLGGLPGKSVPVMICGQQAADQLAAASVTFDGWWVTAFFGAYGAVLTAFDDRLQAERCWQHRAASTVGQLNGFIAAADLFNPIRQLRL